ncbi:MAG: transcriptional regulator [Comamonadaceae bacterium]|nr:MAG: transcriptional regulator [Comamonadaceae bacterium]
MANYSVAPLVPSLDLVFLALGDPTRRAIVGRLGAGAASVTELAAPFTMALPSFMKHLGVLERSGLIRSSKTGRTRTCELEPRVLESAQSWLDEQRALWESRTDRLANYVEQLHQKEKSNAARQKPRP